MLEETLARLREDDASWAPLEELDFKHRLEFAKLAAERRLGGVQAYSGASLRLPSSATATKYRRCRSSKFPYLSGIARRATMSL